VSPSIVKNLSIKRKVYR